MYSCDPKNKPFTPLPWCLPARSRFGEGRGEGGGEGDHTMITPTLFLPHQGGGIRLGYFHRLRMTLRRGGFHRKASPSFVNDGDRPDPARTGLLDIDRKTADREPVRFSDR